MHQPHHRVRRDPRSHGNVIARIKGQLHHIGLGRHLHGTPIIMLIDDLDVRIIDANTAEILRTLTINPTRHYHGTGQSTGGPRRPDGPRKTRTPNLNPGSAIPMSRDITMAPSAGFEPAI